MDFEKLARELAPQVLAVLMRRYRNFASAEDAVQEALLAASQQWPREGLPESPRAWLTAVAGRRMTDEVRRDAARQRREEAVARVTIDGVAGAGEEDDTLVLVFLCCHPALTPASAIALTLRAVGGLTTAEIGRAFLVPEATMAQRISRAKQTIKDSGIPFRMPERGELGVRLRAVLHVFYLIFNEGYAASAGEQLHRDDLATEAIRLTRLVGAKLPGDAEVAGLLALLLLTEARRPARSGPHGEMIPLDRQDRRLWNRSLIAEGVGLLDGAFARGAVGPYQLQAAIAALHDEADSTESTDWRQILALYAVLRRISDNPLVILNQAVAVAMVHGPGEGLRQLEELGAGALRNHYRLFAVRGHLLEMAGDRVGAGKNYQAAAAQTASLPERNYLLEQAARMRDKQENSIEGYARQQAAPLEAICDRLQATIDKAMPEASAKIWHGSPVWFLGANPVVGYNVRGNRVELLFWSGQLFDEPRLQAMGKDKAARLSFADSLEMNDAELGRWLEKARTIVFDYVEMYARKRADTAR